MTAVTVVDSDLMTHEYLESLFQVTDLEVQLRVEHFDSLFTGEESAETVPGFEYLGAGIERVAYYDPQTNLVYKRRHDYKEVNNRECARLERIALYKAHLWLQDLDMAVRYADTRFYVAASGVEYLVQEYIPNVGLRRFRDVVTDEVADILEKTKCSENGISKDHTDNNVGTDPRDGGAVLTDLLEVRAWAWW